MSGIDYSKWDKFCESDESDGSEGASGRPSVTRLQYPSRVTVGPNGVHMETVPPKATASPFNGTSDVTLTNCAIPTTTASAADAAASCNSSVVPPSVPKSRQDDEMEEDEMMYRNLTRNGAHEGESHIWSQTQDTASVSFILPTMQTKGKDIYNFRLCAEEQPDRTSLCVLSFGVRGLQGERRFVFRYPVKVDDEVVEGCWQLHSLTTKSMRLMVVQLVKEPVGVGMSLWWDKCFLTDQTTVDTTKISGRSDAAAARAEQFQKTWEEAHAEFKNRISERQGRQIIIEGADNCEGGDDNE
ncbi:Low complexity protein [Trypanosoma grayi]|uniref:Low complexity protein n=1 Tax=Trypanosoma grayi TaxID=71804 RepID=UPI0004F42027|nr:Low complexity protein [Trypanosoma grayi]KEG10919.1 Low complexity protein [Trypanosoma grayi]